MTMIPLLYRHTGRGSFDITTDLPSLPSNHYDLILQPRSRTYPHEHCAHPVSPTQSAQMMGSTSSYPVHCFAPTSILGRFPRVAHKRFGQFDHVRLFGSADIGRLSAQSFECPSHIPCMTTAGKKTSTCAISRRNAEPGLQGLLVCAARTTIFCPRSLRPRLRPLLLLGPCHRQCDGPERCAIAGSQLLTPAASGGFFMSATETFHDDASRGGDPTFLAPAKPCPVQRLLR